MKLFTISLASATIGFLLCYSCLVTAKQIAKISLVKQEAVFETN